MTGLRELLRSGMRTSALAAAIAIGGLFASSAQAQSQPTNPQAQGDRFHNNGGGYGNRFDDLHNGNGSSSNDFPSAEMGAAVDAYARATAARAAYQRAYDALNMSVYAMQHSFETSSEYRDAVNEEKRAYGDLVAARRMVVEKISSDPRYRAAVSLRDEFAHRVTELRATRGVKMEELVAMAMVKLGYATTATAMEVVASADEPRVRDAQVRLMSAGAHLTELQRRFEDQVRTDPQMVAIRQNLEQARTNNLIAAAVLQGAVDVGNEALDYAYYRHRNDYQQAYNSGSYGYGYGSNYPFYGPIVVSQGGGGRMR